MIDPIIRQRFAAHMRLQGGHAYAYDLLNDKDEVIGSFTKSTIRRKGVVTETRRYILGAGEDAREFDTPSALIQAYKQKLEDEEWNAAEPNGERQ